MLEIYPNYYNKFRCIADKCRHSCCIGWEIDIDDDTMELYSSLDGELGDRIRGCIEGDVPHFVLKEGDRCPFLNQNGLCDIITELGDGAISDICYLHPRFSNFYDDFTETGLGLCCEEAAGIILTDSEKFSIEVPEAAVNDGFFKERQQVFDVLQNRDVSFFDRFETLSERYGFDLSVSGEEIFELFNSLERLDCSWENYLLKLKSCDFTVAFKRDDLQIFFEQLACYFVFRHFKKGIGFALLSCLVLGKICSLIENTDEILDIARMYSSEIEYSEENTQKIIEFAGGLK